MDKVMGFAYEFVASEFAPNYWSVWWEAMLNHDPVPIGADGVKLRCEIRGARDIEPAARIVRDVAQRLGVSLPMLRRKGRNTT